MKEYIVQAIAQETIDSFDAHNAPELVRCKDCKNGKLFKTKCGEVINCDHLMAQVNKDWYCADGERQEGQ